MSTRVIRTALRRSCLAVAGLSLAGLALLAGPAARAADAPRLLRLGAEGGDLRANLSDGRVLHGADLVGATLDFAVPGGAPLRLRIDAAEPDRGGTAPDVWLFSLVQVTGTGAPQPFCSADPDGRHLAIPYPVPGAPGGFALTCSSGAVGKCIRFGYRPWASAPDGTALAPLHAACIHMVRADYGGADRPWTRDGMRIDVYDAHGIQTADPGDPMPFEAGWTADGAACVAHPRVPENGTLADIVATAPRLAGHTGRTACTEAAARAGGALLFNRSASAVQ